MEANVSLVGTAVFKAVEGLYGPWWIRFPHASASPRPEHCFSTGTFVLRLTKFDQIQTLQKITIYQNLSIFIVK